MSIAASFEIEYLQYMDPTGKLVGKDLPALAKDGKRLVDLFKQMLFVRVFDSKAIALQRTGKLGTYASCLGHEATHVGIGGSPRTTAQAVIAQALIALIAPPHLDGRSARR